MSAKVSKYIKELAMDLIRRAPRTANELAARLEISRPHARATLLSLARAGVCHLSEWRGIPGADRQRKYRSTVNGMEAVRTYECSIERKMAREAVKKARASRERFKKVGLAGVDPLMAAIMGVPKHG